MEGKAYVYCNGSEFSIDGYYLHVPALGVCVDDKGWIHLVVGNEKFFNRSRGNHCVGRHGRWPINMPMITLTTEQKDKIKELDFTRAAIAYNKSMIGPYLPGVKNLEIERYVNELTKQRDHQINEVKESLQNIFDLIKSSEELNGVEDSATNDSD